MLHLPAGAQVRQWRDVWDPAAVSRLNPPRGSDDAFIIGATQRPGEIVQVPLRNHSGGEVTEMSVQLADTATGDAQVIRTLPGDSTQAGEASGDDRYVVWTETNNSDSGFADWRMWCYDRHTGRARQVAAHPPGPNGALIKTPLVRPSVDHGVIAWSAAEMADGAPRLDTFVMRGGCQGTAQLFRTDLADPRVAWPYLFAAERIGTTDASRLVRINLADGTQTTLWNHTIRYLAASQAALIAVSWQSDTSPMTNMLLLRSPTGSDPPATQWSVPSGNFPEFPCAGSHFVAWNEMSHTLAYDTRSGDYVVLSDDAGGATCNGATLEWQESRSGYAVRRAVDWS